jgi:hypothetical protein
VFIASWFLWIGLDMWDLRKERMRKYDGPYRD